MKYLFIFDMGGVVVQNCSLWPAVAKALGLPGSADSKKYLPLLQAASRGDITSMENLQITARREHLPEPKENYWDTFFHPVVDEKTAALIMALRNSGQRVVCGTNTIDVHYAHHIASGDYRFFDKVYASNLMGQVKPDITFWHAIRNEEKVYNFTDMLFFDDLAENAGAAAGLGIHACCFKNAGMAADYIRSVTGIDPGTF